MVRPGATPGRDQIEIQLWKKDRRLLVKRGARPASVDQNGVRPSKVFARSDRRQVHWKIAPDSGR